MVKQKPFRLPDQLADKVATDAKAKAISENDWAIDAFRHYLTCKTIESIGAMRLIVLRFPDKCLKCKREVDAGEWALWGRGTGVVCIDCYVERIGDKGLIAKFLKKREYEQIIKALKKEADRLADKVELYGLGETIEAIHNKTTEIHAKVMQYFREAIGTPEEKQKLEEVERLCAKQFEVLENVQRRLERTLGLLPKKRRAKKKEKVRA